MPRWRLINKALGLDHDEPAETYSTSPHFFTDLGIPKGTKGRLPHKHGESTDNTGEEKRSRGRGSSGGRRGGGSGSSDSRRGGSSEGRRGGSSDSRRGGDGDSDAPRKPRRNRERRRTRGGKPVGRASRSEASDTNAE